MRNKMIKANNMKNFNPDYSIVDLERSTLQTILQGMPFFTFIGKNKTD